ncbi:hypothetical protein FOZ62_012414, partial [Perkinsus olseni]
MAAATGSGSPGQPQAATGVADNTALCEERDFELNVRAGDTEYKLGECLRAPKSKSHLFGHQ